MTSVVIPRRYWLRGEGSDKSSLFRAEDGKACCLGHALAQICKMPLPKFMGHPSPQSVVAQDMNQGIPTQVPPSLLVDRPGSRLPGNSTKSVMLMEINDSEDIEDEERERAITTGGQDLGIEFTFIDG